MLVLEYARGGDMRNYLRRSFIQLTWQGKLNALRTISGNLSLIHEAGFIHTDLHPRNILVCDDFKIGDFGLARLFAHCSSPSDAPRIYGVMPYIAPEILQEKPYTPAADIYSFAMIMWEFASGKPPFAKETHDQYLAREICKGKRPEIEDGIPSCYVELIKRCWNVDPQQRPTSKELAYIFDIWAESKSAEDRKQFEEAEGIRKQKAKNYDPNDYMTTNINAIYHGREFSTKEIFDLTRTGKI